MKKYLIGITAMCVLMVSMVCTAFADEKTYTEGTLWYTIEDQSITITGYFGRESEVTVPAIIAGYPVNVIGSGAFAGTNARKINLPDTIMSVKEGAVDSSQTLVYNSNISTGEGERPSNEPGNGPGQAFGGGASGGDTSPILQPAQGQDSIRDGNSKTEAAPNEADGEITEAVGEEAQINIDDIEAADEINHRVQEENRNHGGVLWPVLAIAILALVAVIVILIQRKKKRI